MKKSKETNFAEMGYRWSLFILVIGGIVARYGNENDVVGLKWFGILLIALGAIFYIYDHLANTGILIGIFGLSMMALGNPNAVSTFSGQVLSEAQKSPILLWGIILFIAGFGFWGYVRSRKN